MVVVSDRRDEINLCFSFVLNTIFNRRAADSNFFVLFI